MTVPPGNISQSIIAIQETLHVFRVRVAISWPDKKIILAVTGTHRCKYRVRQYITPQWIFMLPVNKMHHPRWWKTHHSSYHTTDHALKLAASHTAIPLKDPKDYLCTTRYMFVRLCACTHVRASSSECRLTIVVWKLACVCVKYINVKLLESSFPYSRCFYEAL